MAPLRNNLLGLVLILAATFCYEATAQSGCTKEVISLSPCLNYITGNSTTPSSSCCSQLANVVQSQPQCLCTVVNGGAASSLGISINQTLALSLPGACNVQTPPVSQCNGAASPPAALPTVPSGTTSKTVPTTAGSTSDGSFMKIPLGLALFISSSMLYFNIGK
ncbi:hypothetical protein SLEP1_g55370 [Rubroshorea leprosula]|uniref:Bifunctional inhibitor/plant lipid transfer protein/seed storage helical domain-containing protein n=1 Tax=Rubroshorea leprosula TaxID=152421 RepID=A0AAV5MGA9_9ROSI|nr:hypothetical protein SLEP1_g55370 [Rubroshorea leprosula]